MNPFRRFFLGALIEEAHEYGTLVFTETAMSTGFGWTVAIRPPYGDGTRPRYAWSGQGTSMKAALRDALKAARAEPEMRLIQGAQFAPKLGGRDNDA